MALSNQFSRLFGKIAGYSFPKFIQEKINFAYVKYFNIDMSEFKDFKEYESLNALFTRKLCIQRKLDEGFISPSDGEILECGSSFKAGDESFAFAIKGFTYSINELLQGALKEQEKEFEYINIYLAPKDYHRYHAPCDMKILSAVYTSGVLHSVDTKHLQEVANLYTKNERVVLECEAKDKLFYLVFVGALNVGKMRFNFDESIQTNAAKIHNFTHKYENLELKKGEELGHFELGSTIVIITPKDMLSLSLKTGESLKFGQKLGELLG